MNLNKNKINNIIHCTHVGKHKVTRIDRIWVWGFLVCPSHRNLWGRAAQGACS